MNMNLVPVTRGGTEKRPKVTHDALLPCRDRNTGKVSNISMGPSIRGALRTAKLFDAVSQNVVGDDETANEIREGYADLSITVESTTLNLAEQYVAAGKAAGLPFSDPAAKPKSKTKESVEPITMELPPVKA